jgi:hypothetical protein
MAEYISAFFNFLKPDERFIMHRYQSSRVALIVMVLLTAVWFEYELLANHLIRWDLLIILIATMAAKVGSMVYYRLKQ